MPKHTTERFTRREREIMNALFALGNRASAEEIRTRLTSPPSDSSVRVMLARLEKQGYLKHQQDGLRYIYSSTISPAIAKRTALQQYLQTFFGGSQETDDDGARQGGVVERRGPGRTQGGD
jgi:predicted transcriptional regulator